MGTPDGNQLPGAESNAICNIVYAAEFNADGSVLASGDSAGRVSVYDVLKFASSTSCPVLTAKSEKPVETNAPSRKFETNSGSIYALHSQGDALVCGVDDGIVVTSWDAMSAGKPPLVSLQLTSPYPSDSPCEVNGLAGSAKGKSIFAAAGDGNAYCVSLERMQQTTCFVGDGPSAYLHCITMCGGNQESVFLTGGDDGSVRMYDARAGPNAQKIDLPDCAGKPSEWVSSIVTDDDGVFAMVGTGSRQLSALHVSTKAVAHSRALDMVPAALKKIGNTVYCGGVDTSKKGKCCLQRFNMQCEPAGVVHSSLQGVYSIAVHPTSNIAATSGYALSACSRYTMPGSIDVYLSPPLHSFTMTSSHDLFL